MTADTKYHDIALLAHASGVTNVNTTSPTPTVTAVDGTHVEGRVAVLEYLAGEYKQQKLFMGANDEEYAQIHQWISYAHQTVEPGLNDQSAQKSFGKFLNDSLKLKTYLVGSSSTLADFVLFSSVYPYVAQMPQKRRFDLCHLVRWFDLVQHSDIVLNYKQFAPVEISLDVPNEALAAPVVNQKAKEVKKETKKENQAQQQPTGEKKEKKEKKEKPPKEKKVDPAELPVNNPVRLDIKVGKIVSVKQHENADSLYVEQIDLGEAAPRTIVSGLVKHIPIDQMLDRFVLVLANLKPANMRGVKSEGMVLAATGKDGKVELLAPPQGSTPGERAFFEGFSEGTADAQLNPKKKVWETIQPGLFTDDSKVASYKVMAFDGTPDPSGKVCKLQTTKGPVTVPTVTGASIK